MEEETFHVQDDKMYCSKHFKQLFSKMCSSCNKEIEGQYIQVLDCYYHPDCWNCSKCHKPLSESVCTKRDGQFFCGECAEEEEGGTTQTPVKQAPSRPPPIKSKTKESK